ncbi:hypothetical protein GSI_09725 [Ganoderma sinense ZZ0214-1]|uniref:Uncharacterized protein n=1 Tax=Ganoderma sinense ZZ0214-1 TaxID=1077348 RepID=A0A2G8S3P4_9APHY|nr:hypothetical protein GSI_09725 [Ganoderma sinense ZZ0214-1]
MPPIVLPPKVFKTLAPAIKGYRGVAREVPYDQFINVFKHHWGCSVQRHKKSAMLVTPPKNQAIWPFPQRAFRVYKPSAAHLNRQDLQRLRTLLNKET